MRGYNLYVGSWKLKRSVGTIFGVVSLFFMHTVETVGSYGSQYAELAKEVLLEEGISEDVFDLCVFPYLYEKRWGLLDVFTGCTDSVASICFTPNGKYIVAGADDGLVRTFSIDMGKEYARAAVRNVYFLQNDEIITSDTYDDVMRSLNK